ncbi:MAG: cell division ATP-binding protein FtsE [Parcubacteria group bacterium]|nr:cell division ATP-binding protein FtsE [Parcubacteria group bacterium]MCR4342725.1 cell division ATP-binding protein FtsE [Patescibacteria group bacterium]
MIYFDKVSKIYAKNSVAIEEISFTVEPQEFVSLVGQSGAGKTTLLKLLLAEESPTDGKVFFESINVHSVPKVMLTEVRRKIGVVFQDFRLLPNKTVFENIAFAMEAAGKKDEDIRNDVPQVMDLVGLEDKGWRFPNELSGGERQRVAIARAIVNQPDLIIADEPTGNLDPLNTWEIINILKKVNELGTTVVLATHNKGIIDSLNKRVITLEGGRITRDDKEGRYIL